MNVTSLKDEFGIDATKVVSLRSNVAIIECEKAERTILKRARKTKGGNRINNHRFSNELRIYKTLEKSQFRFLHTPRLLQSGDDYMILQYVEKLPGKKVSFKEFAHAYLELQTLQVPPRFWFDFKNQLSRGFYYKGLITPLFTNSKHIGVPATISTIRLFLKLCLQATRLKNRYWLHGDVTNTNVYYNIADEQLYFIDFENLVYTRKWPLVEIIHRCIWMKDGGYGFYIDAKCLKYYLDRTTGDTKADFSKLNLKHQIRFSLLMLCINNIAIAKSDIKRNTFKRFLKIINNDKLFTNWFNTYVAPGLSGGSQAMQLFSV